MLRLFIDHSRQLGGVAGVSTGLAGHRRWILRAPVIWNCQEVLAHEFPESLLVIPGGNHRWQFILGHHQRRFHHCLQLLVPCILPQVVDDAKYELMLLPVHSNQQRVVHNIDRLQAQVFLLARLQFLSIYELWYGSTNGSHTYREKRRVIPDCPF